jgi:2-haloacid dehalogenase
VRSGEREWTILDVLHREALDDVLAAHGVDLPAEQRDELNLVWHRLDPWPDTVPGLTRLKERCIVAPVSNGNIALLVDMARHAGLPWDAILGAELARAYKPRPEAYLRSVEALGLRPGEVMMVAAHNGDLVAAGALGLMTAFVPRPAEHGPAQTTDLQPEHDYDVVARDLIALADVLA